MIGTFLFLCLLGTTLGGYPLPDKPFNPEYRAYRPQHEVEKPPDDYTTTTEKDLVNNEDPVTKGEEPDLNKELGSNITESEPNITESEPNKKNLEPNSKVPHPNSKELVSRRNEIEPTSKEAVLRSEESNSQNPKEILQSSPIEHTPVLKNSQQAISQERDELLLTEKPVLKNYQKHELCETDLANKESDILNKESELAENLKLELDDEVEKTTLRASQPILLDSGEYVKIPKDYIVKWIRNKIAKERMNLREKRVKYKSPDYSLERKNHLDRYKEVNDDSTYILPEDAGFLQSQGDSSHISDQKAKVYNGLLPNIFETIQYAQNNQDTPNIQQQQSSTQAELYKELLAKIIELLQYLMVDQSLNARYPEDQKTKMNKDILGNILILIQKLLLEDQNSSPLKVQKRKINKELLGNIIGLLQILTERQGLNARQFESSNPNTNEELLAKIFTLLQNLKEEHRQDTPPLKDQKNKVNNELITNTFSLFQNLPAIYAVNNKPKEEDQNTTSVEGEKTKVTNEEVTKLFTIFNALKDQDQNTSSLEGEKKVNNEQLTQLFAMFNSQKEQDQNTPSLEEEKTKSNNKLLTQLLAIFNAQKDQDENTPSLEEEKTKSNNKLLTQLFAIFNAQKDQDQNTPSLEEDKTKSNNELLATFNTQKEQDQYSPSLEEDKTKSNNELLTQLLPIFNAQKDQDENTPSLEEEKTKSNNKLLTQLLALFNAQKGQSSNTPSLEEDKTKVSNRELTQLIAIFNAQKGQDQNAPEDQKSNVNYELLTQLLAVFLNVPKENSKNSTSEEQKSNINYKLLAEIIAVFMNQGQTVPQAPPQPPGYNAQVLQYQQSPQTPPPEEYNVPQTLPPVQGPNVPQGYNQGTYQTPTDNTAPVETPPNPKQQSDIGTQTFPPGQNQNYNQLQIQPDNYGSNAIRMKLLQLIKDTKDAIDLKVRPVRMVHEAYRLHRFYKIGYLISSINRTHDSVLDFYKHIQENIKSWNMLKVLQAFEQVKAADQFISKALEILSIISGNKKFIELHHRILHSFHKRALELANQLTRKRNDSTDLGLELTLDPKKDLEDTHGGREYPKTVSQDTREIPYGPDSRRKEKVDTYKKLLGRNQQKTLKYKFYRILKHNQKPSKDASERASNNQRRVLVLARSIGPELQRNQKDYLKRNYERPLKHIKMALKYKYKRALGNHEVLGPNFERLLQRKQKGDLKDISERSIGEKTDVERSIEPELERNQKDLQRNSERVIQRKNNRALKYTSKIVQKKTKVSERTYNHGIQPNQRKAYLQKRGYPYDRDSTPNPPVLTICNYNGHIAPCNPKREKLGLKLQYNQPLSWSYYDDDY